MMQARRVRATPAVADGPLPRVLVVDDELGLAGLLAAVPGPVQERWSDRWLAFRRRYCERFGIVAERDEAHSVERPVARGRFLSGLEWQGEGFARLEPELVLDAIEDMRREPEGLALVVLDLVFSFGGWDDERGELSARHSAYGADVLLPLLKERFGVDATTPGPSWCAVPVLVVSSLPKHDLEVIVRTRGARGMLAKEGEAGPAECRTTLAAYLRSHGWLPDPRGVLLGRAPAFLNALSAARRAAAGASSILVTGESGSGKELLARYIHDHSPRAGGPYRVFHAAGRGEELQEDELFGHWAGAFTGAAGDRPGLLEAADGGTVFIDEIGEVGPRVQNALMRPLQERVVERIGQPRAGAAVPRAVDVLFVFATNKDLAAQVASGAFKPDLLTRIEEVHIAMPALRQRPEDIVPLAQQLLAHLDSEIGGIEHYLDEGALQALAERPFSGGNVRELRNLLRAAALANPQEARLTEGDLGGAVRAEGAPASMPPGGDGTTSDDLAGRLRRLATLAARPVQEMTLREVDEAASLSEGLAAEALVALLEVSCTVCRARGQASLTRIMCHFWGREAMTPQQARRALERVLAVEWQGRLVAALAARSAVLRSVPRVWRVVAQHPKPETQGDA